jgi:hypothetical protein
VSSRSNLALTVFSIRDKSFAFISLEKLLVRSKISR